jgi:hypothetical protein
MFMVSMISRLRCASALTPVLVVCALLTAACQKVPLLAPSGSTITLTAAATALPANGTTDIIAQVIEASGTPPHSGTHVSFTTNLGSVQPSEAETDISGKVVVKYVAGAGSGTATITAISGGVSASGTNAIKIAIGAAAIGKVTADANPTTIPATGGTSLITATAFDVNGNLIGGVPMTFTTDAGAMSPAVANTDANGKAQSTLTTTKAATVTVSAGLATTTGTGTTATTTAQTATVKVNVNVSPGVTIGAPSPAAPTVGQSVTFPLTYSTDANASPIVSTTVDFGDGSTPTVSAGKPGSVSHIYNSGGSYSVRATVLDSLGDTSTSSTSVLVGARPQPVVSIAATTPNPTAGSDVAFTASVAPAAGSGTNIASVTVVFDTANPSTSTVDLGAVSGTAIALHHVYPNLAGGTYTVVLTARDTNGGVGTAVTTVFVQPAAPLAVTISRSGTTIGTTRTETFTATVTGLGNAVVLSYLWEIDGVAQPTQTTNQFTKDYLVGSGAHVTKVTVTTSSGASTSNSITFIE